MTKKYLYLRQHNDTVHSTCVYVHYVTMEPQVYIMKGQGTDNKYVRNNEVSPYQSSFP